VKWWAVFVVELRFIGWPVTRGLYLFLEIKIFTGPNQINRAGDFLKN
jgi:uncharacterized membrane protein